MPRTDLTWQGQVETVVPSATRTTSGDSGSLYGYGPSTTLRAQLVVTAAAGTTPTLDVVVEDTLDGTNWNSVAAFARKTAAGREAINITTPFADQLRVRWTVGGVAPSFTFSVAWAVE